MQFSLGSPKRALRYYWLRLIRLRGNPFVIARGLAVGTFVGVTPTIPFHTILTIGLCTLFRGNILAGIIANWIVSNPVSIPFEYYLSWKVGVWITGSDISWNQVQKMLNLLESVGFLEACQLIFQKFLEIIYCLVIGGVIIGIPAGIACYFLASYFYFWQEKRRQEKFLKRISRHQSSHD